VEEFGSVRSKLEPRREKGGGERQGGRWSSGDADQVERERKSTHEVPYRNVQRKANESLSSPSKRIRSRKSRYESSQGAAAIRKTQT